jgi:hypothetical protein
MTRKVDLSSFSISQIDSAIKLLHTQRDRSRRCSCWSQVTVGSRWRANWRSRDLTSRASRSPLASSDCSRRELSNDMRHDRVAPQWHWQTVAPQRCWRGERRFSIALTSRDSRSPLQLAPTRCSRWELSNGVRHTRANLLDCEKCTVMLTLIVDFASKQLPDKFNMCKHFSNRSRCDKLLHT